MLASWGTEQGMGRFLHGCYPLGSFLIHVHPIFEGTATPLDLLLLGIIPTIQPTFQPCCPKRASAVCLELVGIAGGATKFSTTAHLHFSLAEQVAARAAAPAPSKTPPSTQDDVRAKENNNTDGVDPRVRDLKI